MNKLIKIAPIIVLLACGGSLFFAYRIFQMKKDHLAKIDDLNNSLNKANNDLRSTQAKLGDTQKTLTTTLTNLALVTKDLQGTKAALDQRTQEAEGLKTQMANREKQIQSATAELANVKQEMENIVTILKGLGIEGVQSIAQIRDKVQGLVGENKVLNDQLTKMRDENKQLQDKVYDLSTTPVNTRGRVANVQDRWGFLVLNIGEEQKVRKHSQFLIYRDNKPVSVVQILWVGPTVSVAEILPDYRRGTPRVGDIAVH